MKKLTHDEFINRLSITNQHFINGDFEVIGVYINIRTPVLCKCKIHDYTWEEVPEKLYLGRSCPKCDNRKCCEDNDNGVQTFGNRLDLWTTHPQVAKLLKNPQDGYRYTYGTSKKLEFLCPHCGTSRYLSVNGVVHYGFSCPKCSDGISLPNKYSRALLDQVLLDGYICEYRPDWAKPYFYDNYFEYNNQKYILEMDGAYHYLEKEISQKSLAERQQDDMRKDELARLNGVDVIRINCSIPYPTFIREQILQSQLAYIFDLSVVDWVLCDAKSHKNLVREACDIYMQKLYPFTQIRKILHIGKDTLIRYLKTGARLGWCDYNSEKHKAHRKPVVLLDDNGNVLYSFSGLRECVRQIKNLYGMDVCKQHIVTSCKTRRPYKGLRFRFINDIHDKMIEETKITKGG